MLRSLKRGPLRSLYITSKRLLRGVLPSSLYLRLRDQLIRRGDLDESGYDPDTQAALSRLLKPGDIAFDVGANVGMLTVAMSHLVGAAGKVYAFEAHPDCVTVLNTMVRRQQLSNCRIVWTAVAEHSGQQINLYSDDRPGLQHMASSLHDMRAQPTGPGRILPMSTLALDDYCDQESISPHLVKIDVEGAETSVLRGFRRELARSKPHLILETGGAAREDFSSLFLLEEYGYRLALPNPWRWISAGTIADRLELQLAVVAIHADKTSEGGWISNQVEDQMGQRAGA
jgi:FkbM family methyltransferase